MDTIKNVTQLFVAKNQTMTAGLEGTVISVPGDLLDGEVVITDPKNVVLDATDFTTIPFTAIKFIQRSGDVLVHSDVIEEVAGVSSYLVGLQAAETQQLDYVGFNGVTGELDVLASNIYTIRLNVLDKLTAGFMQQKIKEGFYKSNANATSYTQWAIAEGLVNSLIANYSRETEQDLTFGVTNSGANVDLGTGAGDVTFTKGSKYAVFGTAIDDATTNAILLVGDLLAATDAKTEDTYRVVSIDVPTETCELDHAWQGATVTVANATVGRVIGATAQAADYGVKIQGVDREFKAGYFPSNVMFWETQIDFGDLSVVSTVSSTAAYPGVGTGQQLGMLEKELQADEHIYRGHVEAGVIDRVDIVPATLYDVFVIGYNGEIQSGGGLAVQSPKTIQIATAGTSNNNNEDANTGLLVTLNALFVTAGRFAKAAVAQTVTT